MKKIVMPVLIVAIIISAIVTLFLSMAGQEHIKVVVEGNREQKALSIKPHEYQCSECKMPIESLQYSAQVIAPGGKTYFFDDTGCMVLWLKDKSFRRSAVLWVYSVDTQRWIDGRKAWYSLTDETLMGYGFAPYERKDSDKIDFDTMELKMLRGETLLDPYIRKKLLGK
jgi:copper chaperone NosL